MTTARKEIEGILLDCYDEDEEMSAWGVAFEDGVSVPFNASLLGSPVEVQGFQVTNAGVVQCQVAQGERRKWIGIEDLDDEGLPEDFQHVLTLYQSWIEGDY